MGDKSEIDVLASTKEIGGYRDKKAGLASLCLGGGAAVAMIVKR